MAEIIVEGVNLGYTEKPYDFTDDATGKKVSGVSQRLHVLVGTEVLDERVPEAKSLPEKSSVVLKVNVPKNARLAFVELAA
jgi:hypothetical protein